MIRLLRVEAARLLARRFTVFASLGVLLVVAAFQLLVNSEVSPPSAADVTSAQRAYEENRQDWEQNHQTYEQECRDAGEPPESCAVPAPQLSDYLPSTPFDEIARIALQGSVYVSALVGFLIAGSFIGAEFTTGAITNWLSFVPRRGAVYASKIAVVALFAGLLAALASALTLASSLVIAAVYEVATPGVPGLVALAGRGVLPAVGMAMIGFALGLLTRHTVAALGVLLGYLFVWFVRNAFLGEMAWAVRLTPWTPEGNIAAIVEKGHRYSVPIRSLGEDGYDFTYLDRTVTLAHGLTYWIVLVLAVAAVGWLVFRRRDVV